MQSLGAELHSFRPSSRALAPLFLLPAVLAIPMALRKLLVDDASLAAVGLALLVAAVVVLVMFLLLLPLLSFFAVHVHELGLKGTDAYGRSALVAWPFIRDVAPVSLLGLEYLRIRPTGAGRELWLPRFLVEQKAFERLVSERAGPGHPLTLGLARS